MQARLIGRGDGYRHYVANRDRREWLAVHNVVTGAWTITNERGMPVGDWSQLGMQIINACESAFCQAEAGQE